MYDDATLALTTVLDQSQVWSGEDFTWGEGHDLYSEFLTSDRGLTGDPLFLAGPHTL